MSEGIQPSIQSNSGTRAIKGDYASLIHEREKRRKAHDANNFPSGYARDMKINVDGDAKPLGLYV